MKTIKRIIFFAIIDIIFFIIYYLINMAGDTFAKLFNWGDISLGLDIFATVISWFGFYAIFLLESTDRKKHGLEMIAKKEFPAERDIWNPIKTIKDGNYDLLIYMIFILPIAVSYLFAPFSFGNNTIFAEIFFPHSLIFKIINIPVVSYLLSVLIFYLIQSISRYYCIRSWKNSELTDKEKEMLTEDGRIDYRL